MRANRIIHPGLAEAVASLGHSDLLLVTDAGFPIPRCANRIDLGFTKGVADVRDILASLLSEVFIEDATFAPELKTHHPKLYREVQAIFTGTGATFSAASHEELCDDYAYRAKFIVRSGSFDPWANFAMTASTDPFAWFDDDDVRILPAYIERRELIRSSAVPDLQL